MLMQLSCGCCDTGGLIYADFLRPGVPPGAGIEAVYAPLKDALETISGNVVAQLLPSSLSDLDDCEVYCLGCFGAADGSFTQGQIMTLNSTQRGIIADWVNAGGKLLCCVDYKNLTTSGGALIFRAVDTTFYNAMEQLISDAGGSLTFGREDAINGSTPNPYDKATFLSDSWTTGITGEIEYDGTAGSSISGGTQLFAPVARNTIVKQQCGSGWIVCHGSRNSLWGNEDENQTVPTGYTAITEFLQFFYDL
jgi:hypothetical protein